MQIIDLHSDTILRFLQGKGLSDEDGHVSLEKLQRGDVLAQCFAIFVPHEKPEACSPFDVTARDYMSAAYARFTEEIRRSGTLEQVHSARELRQMQIEGRMGAILTVENCVALDGELSRLDEWAAMGVKMAALTWNYENSLGYPNCPSAEEHARGLKPFGIEAVRRMNELGIAVDVSHLNEGGFWDVARYSEKPFIASHSCARALCDHPRNLTDEQLRALGDHGGVVGVNYYAAFVSGAQDNTTTATQIVTHLRHMANVAGTDAVALGSDYDGMNSTLSWGDAGGQQAIVHEMESSFTSTEIENICWKNALRAFGDIWGA